MDASLKYGEPFYCDAGRHDGMYAVPLVGRLYLTGTELELYRDPDGGGLRLAVGRPATSAERAAAVAADALSLAERIMRSVGIDPAEAEELRRRLADA